MKKLIFLSNIVLFFILILFIGSYFSLEDRIPLQDLIQILLDKAPYAIVGAILIVILQARLLEWGKVDEVPDRMDRK